MITFVYESYDLFSAPRFSFGTLVGITNNLVVINLEIASYPDMYLPNLASGLCQFGGIAAVVTETASI